MVEQLENEHGQDKKLSLDDFSDYLISKKTAPAFLDEEDYHIDLVPYERYW